MEAVAPHSMYNSQHLDSAQSQVPHGVQINHCDHRTLPIVDVAGQLNDRGWNAVEIMSWRQGSEVAQATELDIDVGLALMNLNDGTTASMLTQPATATASLEPSSTADTAGDISAGAALNACTVLKNELDVALNAYRQSREVMLWHSVNVCRVTMEYIRALQVANRVQG
ncbi:hypothetical protein V8D89_007461 [Ganoderma adspersum]